MPQIKTYIINLDRNPDRLEAMQSGMEKFGLAYERFAAIDGAAISVEDYEQFQNIRPRDGRGWNRGQMGCFLSHFGVWQKAAASDQPYTAIFEDDMHLSPSLPAFLQEDQWIPQGCDIVRLETSTNRVRLSKKPIGQKEGRKIFSVLSTSWCAGGYIISRECAQRLIALPTTCHSTSDDFLFCHERMGVAKTLSIAQIVPALCVQDKFFYLNASDVKFESNIVGDHEGTTLQARVKYAFKRSPLTFIRKSLQGYKRIPFTV